MAIIEIRGLVLADSADGTYTSYVIASGIPTTRQTMRSASITVDGAVTGSSLKVAYGSGNLTIEVREKSLAGKMLYGQIIYYCERT